MIFKCVIMLNTTAMHTCFHITDLAPWLRGADSLGNNGIIIAIATW